MDEQIQMMKSWNHFHSHIWIWEKWWHWEGKMLPYPQWGWWKSVVLRQAFFEDWFMRFVCQLCSKRWQLPFRVLPNDLSSPSRKLLIIWEEQRRRERRLSIGSKSMIWCITELYFTCNRNHIPYIYMYFRRHANRFLMIMYTGHTWSVSPHVHHAWTTSLDSIVPLEAEGNRTIYYYWCMKPYDDTIIPPLTSLVL